MRGKRERKFLLCVQYTSTDTTPIPWAIPGLPTFELTERCGGMQREAEREPERERERECLFCLGSTCPLVPHPFRGQFIL